MEILRTPEECFADLADFPFQPSYVTFGKPALRLAYIDEGPRDADPVLLMHGEPSWSYLYRHIIPALSQHHRVLAPDLIGFGRSDKPAAADDYSYERHVGWMSDWLMALNLKRITLFCQDWGGLIGLRLVAAFPDRFARVIVANTGLPTGSGMIDAFQSWLQFSQAVPEFPTGTIVDGASVRALIPSEIAAYDAPFPEERYKVAARVFPLLVPVTPEHASVAENLAAWEVLDRFDKPFLTAFSDADPVTKGGERLFQTRVPGAQGQPHVTLPGGHFLQEDCPEQIAALIERFIAA